MLLANVPFWPTAPLSLAGFLLGLTLPLWRPILLYPFLAAYNLVLYHADARRAPDRPALLRYHSAFWDEHQRLLLLGLDDHVVLVAERNADEGQAAIKYLISSRQRWAAWAAQIELDARRLERYVDVEAIGHAHRCLAAGELDSKNPIAPQTYVTLNQGATPSYSHPLQRKEKEAMSTEQNKKVVLRWREERNKGNWNIIDELHAPDYVGHIAGVPGPIRGREALKQLFVAYWAAFDVHATPEPHFLIGEGDMVVIRETVRAKHKGAFQGIPPTGKEATVTSIDIYQIVGGKIVEQWTEADMLGLMQQLGVIPTPEQGTP
jgi:steroid delta-isomerase-like uncharacterized protein